MMLDSLQAQKLMVATGKLPYSAQSVFPLLSLGKTIQHTPKGRMVLNHVNPTLICRAQSILCASHQFLKIRPLPWGFLLWCIMLRPSTWLSEGLWPGAPNRADSAVISVICRPWDTCSHRSFSRRGEQSWDPLFLHGLCPSLAAFLSHHVPARRRCATQGLGAHSSQGRAGQTAPAASCTRGSAPFSPQIRT